MFAIIGSVFFFAMFIMFVVFLCFVQPRLVIKL